MLNANVINSIAIVAGLQDDDKNPIMMHNVNYLLDKLGSTKKWEDIAKLLYITHRAMKCESLVFIREFEKRDFNNIVSLPEHKEDISILTLCSTSVLTSIKSYL